MSWAAVLGLVSGLCVGTADFFGGLTSRRQPALAVAIWSQLIGGAGLLVLLLLTSRLTTPAALLWGIAGGLCSGAGLLCFYQGMAIGALSLVAPIAASGTAIPVAVGFAGGERPGAVALGGLALTLAGIVLVSLQPGAPLELRDASRAPVGLALGAALGFGLFYVLVARGTAVAGASPLWAVAGARIGSLSLLLVLLMAGPGPRIARWPGRLAGPLLLIGVLDMAGNLAFAYASTRGDLSVVAVLASLYPAVTVVLGRVVLREQLPRVQGAGVLCALLGCVLLSAG